jgi:membrane protein DedA with SNARE-associated domain
MAPSPLIAALGFGCIPVGLLGMAALVAEQTPLAVWQSVLAVFAGSAVASAACIYGGWRGVRKGRRFLRRSSVEWRQNMNWVKHVLQHSHGNGVAQTANRSTFETQSWPFDS